MNYRTPIFTAAYPPAAAEHPRTRVKAPFRPIRHLLATLRRWHHRSRQRTALSELDDRMLNDIGLTRADVTREIRKSFWRR